MRLAPGISQAEAVERIVTSRGTVQSNNLRVEALSLGIVEETESDTDEEDETVTPVKVECLKCNSEGRAFWDPVRDNTRRVFKKKAKREEKLPTTKLARRGDWMAPEAPPEAIVTEIEEEEMCDAESRPQEPTDTGKENEKTNTAPEKTNTAPEKTSLENTKTTKQESSSDNKPKTPPKRLSDMLREEFRPDQLLKRILDQPLSTVTMRDLFGAFPELAKLLHRKLNTVEDSEKVGPDTNGIKVSQLRVGDMLLPDGAGAELYTAQTPKVRVMINGRKQYALIDIGAEICMISLKTAQECGLPIRMDPQVHVIGATGHATRFRGVCEDVEVDIGGVVIKVPIFVAEKPDQELLLGIPFERKSRMAIQFLDDGSCEARIHSEDGQKRVTMEVSAAYHRKNKMVHDIFAEDSLND